jgi:hypothetical protein
LLIRFLKKNAFFHSLPPGGISGVGSQACDPPFPVRVVPRISTARITSGKKGGDPIERTRGENSGLGMVVYVLCLLAIAGLIVGYAIID